MIVATYAILNSPRSSTALPDDLPRFAFHRFLAFATHLATSGWLLSPLHRNEHHDDAN
jgi:hypothetical protein